MRDPRKKKLRDLRRIARSRGYNPSIYDLFDKYHPEVRQILEKAETRFYAEGRCGFWLEPEYRFYNNSKYEWVTKIAGYWDAVGGAPPSWFRRSCNCQRRARQNEALRCAERDDAWDGFLLPREYRDVRWNWW